MLHLMKLKFIYGFLIGFFIVLVILKMKNSPTFMPVQSLLYNSFLVGTACGLFFTFIQLLFCIISNVDDDESYTNSSSNNYIDDNYDGSGYSDSSGDGMSDN